MMNAIECVTKDFTSPSFLLNESFFLLHYKKKNEINEIGVNEFLHKFRNLNTSSF